MSFFPTQSAGAFFDLLAGSGQCRLESLSMKPYKPSLRLSPPLWFVLLVSSIFSKPPVSTGGHCRLSVLLVLNSHPLNLRLQTSQRLSRSEEHTSELQSL